MSIQLTSQNYFSVTSQPVVVLDFWASWCGPCRMFGPIFEQVAARYANRQGVVFAKCNIEEQPDIAKGFAVQAVPTVIILRGGQVAFRQSGLMRAAALDEVVERFSAT